MAQQLPQHLNTENTLNILNLNFNPNFNQLHFGLIEQMHAAALKLRANRELNATNNSPISPLTPNSPSHLSSLTSNLAQLNGGCSLPIGTNSNLTNTTSNMIKNNFSTFSVDALLGAAAKQNASILESTVNNKSMTNNLSTNSLFNTSLSSSSSTSSIESTTPQHTAATINKTNKTSSNIDKTKTKIKKSKKNENNKITKLNGNQSDQSRSNSPGNNESYLKNELKIENKKIVDKKQTDKSKLTNNAKHNLDSKLDSSFDANFDDEFDEEELEDEENLNVCDDSMDYDEIKANLKRDSFVQQHLAQYPILDSMSRHLVNTSPSSLLTSTATLYNPLNGQLTPNFYSNFFPTLPALNSQAEQTTPSSSTNSTASTNTNSTTINGQTTPANYFANTNWQFLTGQCPPTFGSFSSMGNSKFLYLVYNFILNSNLIYQMK